MWGGVGHCMGTFFYDRVTVLRRRARVPSKVPIFSEFFVGVHVWGCETRSTDELYVSLTQTRPTILWRALLLRLARPVDHVYIP